MKSKNAAVHTAIWIFPYFSDVVEQQKNPVANAHTHNHTQRQRDIERERETYKHAVTHTVARWGEGFNKPTATWIYGGVSGPSQKTRWTYLPWGTERNSEGGSEGWREGRRGGQWSHRHIMPLIALTFSLCCHQSLHSPTPSLLTSSATRKPCPQTLMCLSEKMPNHVNNISCHLCFHRGLGSLFLSRLNADCNFRQNAMEMQSAANQI